MADTWDDDGSDDAWDVDSDEDDQLTARLNQVNKPNQKQPLFDDEDEEDLTLKEKEQSAAKTNAVLKTKGQALAKRKAAEAARKEEEELARRAMELELEREQNLTPEERRLLEKKRVEDADQELTNDLFGGVDDVNKGGGAGAGGKGVAAGDAVKMVTLKDHLLHARRVADCLKGHQKVHLASAFLKEVITNSKDALDASAAADLVSTLNVIKNEKVAAEKRKVKFQAKKSQKRDKAAEAKAKKLQEELFGDNDKFDAYDEYGEQYEDDFF